MSNSLAYCCDCMELMRNTPDKYYDLAVVDPPYGDALANESAGGVLEPIRGTIRQVQIDNLHSSCRARERDAEQRGTISTRTAASQTERGVMRTGGTWATKYAKKSFRGTLRRNRSISRNCFASHVIRLYGVVTTFLCHRQGVF